MAEDHPPQAHPPQPPHAPPTYQGPERRHWDGSELSQLPVWMRAIAIIGIPGAIATYLVWVGSNELPKINRQQEVIAQEVTRVREVLDEQTEAAAAMYRMVQRLCSNAARNDSDRAKCFDR